MQILEIKNANWIQLYEQPMQLTDESNLSSFFLLW